MLCFFGLAGLNSTQRVVCVKRTKRLKRVQFDLMGDSSPLQKQVVWPCKGLLLHSFAALMGNTCFSRPRHFFRTVAGEDQEVSIDRFVEGCMAVWSQGAGLDASIVCDRIARVLVFARICNHQWACL